MLKILLYLIIIILSINKLYAQEATWKYIPLEVDTVDGFYYQTINDIYCYDDSTCLMILTSGTATCIVKKTTDGGDTWHTVFTDTKSAVAYQKIKYYSPNLCYLNGSYQKFYKSTDDGGNWDETKLSWDSTYSTDMTDDIYGLRVIYEKETYNYEVFKYTKDGGNNWIDIEIPDEFKDDSFYGAKIINENLLIFKFLDQNLEPYFVRVENYLQQWSKYECPAELTNWFMLDENNFWAIGNAETEDEIQRQIIYHSDDGCRTWKTLRDTADGRLTGVIFTDELNGVAYGADYILLRTTDGGLTWFKDALEGHPAENQGNDVFVINCTTFPTINTAYLIRKFIYATELYKLELNRTSVEENPYKNNNHYSIIPIPNPVPNGTELKIKTNIEINQAINISITDLMGNTRFEKNINDNQSNIITVSEKLELPPGCYFIRLNTGEQVLTEKLIVTE